VRLDQLQKIFFGYILWDTFYYFWNKFKNTLFSKRLFFLHIFLECENPFLFAAKRSRYSVDRWRWRNEKIIRCRTYKRKERKFGGQY
jgi:hypothetical protein